MAIEFDEYEFRAYVDKRVGFSIRKHADWSDTVTKDTVDLEVEQRVERLSPMELVCYLGQFLRDTNGQFLQDMD